MNSDEFDKHAKDNLVIYGSVLSYSKYTLIGVIITLALMAYFLL